MFSLYTKGTKACAFHCRQLCLQLETVPAKEKRKTSLQQKSQKHPCTRGLKVPSCNNITFSFLKDSFSRSIRGLLVKRRHHYTVVRKIKCSDETIFTFLFHEETTFINSI